MTRHLLALLCAIATFGATSAYANEPAKAATKGDAARGQPIASTVCGACHNPDGNSQIATNPKLAGQHAEYLFKQLKNFKAADGKPAERANPVMGGMVAAFDENTLRDLAAYFAAQTPKGGAAKSRETVEAGQRLYRAGDQEKGLPACGGCHGPAGAGNPAQFPRIAGQHAEYTEAQLKAFRDGSRANDPAKMMRTIALKMTDAEIKAVADYIAGLR